MGTLIDLTGKAFGRLTVIRRASEKRHGAVCWECVCICGNTKVIAGKSLKKNLSQSCGCLSSDMRSQARNNRTGDRYGRLVVMRDIGRSRHGQRLLECICDCGNTTVVSYSSLQGELTLSCGCLQKERASVAGKRMGPLHIKNYLGAIRVNRGNKVDEPLSNAATLGRQAAKTIASEAKRRDNYTCRHCGAKNTYLVSHHIYGFADYPEHRESLANLITLCRNCHKLAHPGGTKSFDMDFQAACVAILAGVDCGIG